MLCAQCEVAKTADDDPISLAKVVLPEQLEGHCQSVSDLSHPGIVLDMLQRLWKDQLLCDVTVCVGDGRWRAHRALLAAVSPYFRTMFSSDFVESDEPVIQLHAFRQDTFDGVLNYMYSGHIELWPANVAAVLDAADHLQLSSLRQHCLQYLTDTVTADDATTVWRLARLHGAHDLARHVLTLMLDNFAAAVRDPDFVMLPEQCVAELLAAPYITAKEEMVLKALCRWAEDDLDTRSPAFTRLLRSVFVSQLDTFKLRTTTELHPSLQQTEVQQYLNCHQEEAMSSPRSQDGACRDEEGLVRRPVRRCTDCVEVLMAIGGATCAGFSSGVECLALGYDSWWYSVPRAVSLNSDVTTSEPMARMAEMRSFAAVASDGDHVYVLGGLRDASSLSTCERYSVEDNRFCPLAELPGRLHGAAACLVGRRLFLLAGCLDATVTDKVWMYCEERGQWLERAPLLGARSHHCAAVIRGHVYVIGGIDPTGVYLSSVCRYDPDNDRWTVAPPCGPPRAYAGCAVVGHQLFLMGGHSGRQWLRTVRRLNPLENQWYSLGIMPEPLGQFAAAVFDERIYCLGGFTGADFRRAVLKYSPRTDRWHSVHSLHMARMGLAAATVRVPVLRGSDV